MSRKSCPRCGSTKIVEYEFSFKCLNCKSEFKIDKEAKIEAEDMLTIQEMKGILEELEINEDREKVNQLKEILDDKNDSK
jgi:transposase-like protein